MLLGLVLMTALPAAGTKGTLFGRPVKRDGFHFQVAFGWGGGPTSHGLLHNMELGASFGKRGYTLAYNHIFIMSKDLFKPAGGSDMFGGHMLVFKMPFLVSELVVKIGMGFGENVDMSDGFKPSFGFGWTYGVDLHFPMTATSGITLGLMVVHAVTVDVGHQVAVALFLGYTWF